MFQMCIVKHLMFQILCYAEELVCSFANNVKHEIIFVGTAVACCMIAPQTLYKTQTQEQREELDEKTRTMQELEEERGSLAHQLQIALARADSEALARSIAEETVADLEKEKTMKELEHKDLLAKHRTELANKEALLSTVSIENNNNNNNKRDCVSRKVDGGR